MPYKDPEDAKANGRIYYQVHKAQARDWDREVALERFRLQGVEPLRLDDQKSELICWDCMKETKRTDRIGNRHEVWCEHYKSNPDYRLIKKNFRRKYAKA